LATQKGTTQKRARFPEKNEHPGRPGCFKGQTVEGTPEVNRSLNTASSLSKITKREKRLTKPEQYTLVYAEGSTLTDRFLVLKSRPNQLEFSRYGISVSKLVGKAVIRNRVKRILREILRLTPLCPGWDIILIARSPAADSDYNQLGKSVNKLLSRAHIAAK